ncbi:tRNA-dihydrouridine synthase family protein [Plebeiibacterium marinum]|uniref:tRNA-dihydrouridine synthase n=1 Tax=Plebeiibacterium marinum TaxID=2992111 RepID=A0AAE3MH29_9BACT|nr:tRNA-dihydrouridine synthase family protein [Plebeiobacterium marinum]MCW3807649.1 tRNA-dihydrouridine synthase family protein [Plebeiobacterium marinum]
MAFNSIVGNVDKYFTPFYRLNKQGEFEYEKQLHYSPELNLVPQILANSGRDLLCFARDMLDRGFREINLNIGCPFPMVANRHLGSGLLPYPNELNGMLEAYFSKDLPVQLSVKMRLGWKESSDIKAIMQVLKRFPISELILHPRTGVQKYKGTPDWEKFGEVVGCWDGPIVGNGDIMTNEDIQDKQREFDTVKGWMIGRGLLINPLLLSDQDSSCDELLTTIRKIHDCFIENLKMFGYSDPQILNHLKCFWEYPSKNIDGGARIYKKLRKTGKLDDYGSVLDSFI